MGDLPSWIQTGLAVLVALAAAMAFVYKRSEDDRKVNADALKSAVTEIETAMAVDKKDNKDAVGVERDERRREINRLETAIGDLKSLPEQVSLVGQAVRNLTEKIGDSKVSADRAVDEIKHTVRSLDSKVDTIQLDVASIKSKTTRPQRGTIK